MSAVFVAPTYVAAGTAVTGSGVTLTPGLPAGWAQNDILVLQILQASTDTVATPGGYAILDSKIETVNTGEIVLFWKRATASESAPSVGPAYQAVMHAIRGCPTSGNPWGISAGSTATSTTAVSCPTVTSTRNNCLILAATVGNGAGALATWANANLSGVTTRVNSGNANGHCHAATGLMTSAAATGATTGTLSVSATWMANLTVAFLPTLVNDRVIGSAPMVRSAYF